MNQFLSKHRVLITALISAWILVLQQALSNKDMSWKVIGFAIFIATLGVIGNQWKGKDLTIAGIIGTLCGTAHTIYTTGNFTWNEFMLSSLLALLLAASGSLNPQNKKAS